MAGDRPKICAALVSDDTSVPARVEPYIDYYEVRIDLIGRNWAGGRGVAEAVIGHHPAAGEGGAWEGGNRADRDTAGFPGIQPAMVDIELQSPICLTVSKRSRGGRSR